MTPPRIGGRSRGAIWAFGCVLYEMLRGRPVFDGETVTDIIAAIVLCEPIWARFRRMSRRPSSGSSRVV
jgi:serine/threonine protein kinase